MSRAVITKDFTNEWGAKYKAGQLGGLKQFPSSKDAYIELDGYKAERAEQERMRVEKGEGYNIVPWLTEIPRDCVRLLEC